MRNIVKISLVVFLIGLVSFDNRIALGQYLSGPSGLCRSVPTMAASGLDVVYTNGSVSFPCPVTNLNVVVSAYSSNGLATFNLTYGIDKSMDGVVWQNAGTFTTTETGAATAGARLYSITNVNIGLFGYARCRAITNLAATVLTNVTVTGNVKWTY